MYEAIEKRVRVLKNTNEHKGLILYWMSRDQRAEDNFALLFAQKLAFEERQPLVVVFTLDISYPGANFRHFQFMLKGLKETEQNLNEKNISLIILKGDPVKELSQFISDNSVKTLITDFDPLKIKRKWKSELAQIIQIPFYEVDTHNIVPCWISSDKEEFGAYTIRPKIKRLLTQFLVEIPPLQLQNDNPFKNIDNGWNNLLSVSIFDSSVKPSNSFSPGSKEARKILSVFINTKLESYTQSKSDPNSNVTSGLSPYLHYGQISAQRIAIEILKNSTNKMSVNAFLEELIIRKELADNFCTYNLDYDSINGFKPWASNSLNEHSRDEREYLYTREQFELAKTHDPLWNAAQLEMLKTGAMHGYMRMYWAKKILEWTENPTNALNIANYLNDKYALDGRDPNGYCGTAWSIGGIHDRAWANRPVFGKIRYMNFNGCKRKFNVDSYISHVSQISLP